MEGKRGRAEFDLGSGLGKAGGFLEARLLNLWRARSPKARSLVSHPLFKCAACGLQGAAKVHEIQLGAHSTEAKSENRIK